MTDLIRRLKTSIPEERAREDLRAKVEKEEALLEYIAMMASIEIHDEEKETEIHD